MEKIIFFLIVFGIGSLFEYIKKLRQERADSSRAAETSHQRSVNFKGFQPFSRKMASFMTTAFPPASPEGESGASAKPSRNEVPEQKKPRPAFLPGETIENISGSEPLEVETFDEISTPELQSARQPDGDLTDTEAHYRRWRQAIIDSEILRPKFTDGLR
ncbi:MAG: hypothetical protein HDR85_00590 [Bacteroides sp.]|nr:hypothetical protein [Bacteroides sp.]